MKTDRTGHLTAHVCMLAACIFWGLMAPIGKNVMTNGIDGISMVSFRVAGGALLFWIASLSCAEKHVPVKDRLLLGLAGIFGLVCNQCCYTIGLSMTSPANASIITTSLPIFAMIMAALILKEPVTAKKAAGIATGCTGAVILILTSTATTNDKVGDIRGDMLCLGAQLSFAVYLTLFNRLIKKYNVVTVNKWMFLWAAIIILPLSAKHLHGTDWNNISASTWWGAGYVVFFGTFVAYLLTMAAQKVLRPTIVSTYNYVQPVVAVGVSLIMGIGVLRWSQVMAMILVFGGVRMVTTGTHKNLEKEKEN